MASISTVEGYAAVPPGTYSPTRSRGVTFWPITTPSRSVMIKPERTCFSWNCLMFAAAVCSTSMNAASVERIAASISPGSTSTESSFTRSNLSQ